MDISVETSFANVAPDDFVNSETIASRLEQIQRLYDEGMYVQAYEVGKPWGKLTDWPGTDGKILAARLAVNLGSSSLSNWLVRCAYRASPEHDEARYFYGNYLARHGGWWKTWRWLRRQPEMSASTSDDIRSSWYALHGEVTGFLRDFSTADTWLRKAEAAGPNNPWVKVCRAGVLEYQDRYDDAEAEARAALAMRPWYRPAVQSLGHLLTLQGKDHEALEFLSEASSRLESYAVTGQLLAMQIELKDYAGAKASLDRIDLLSPLKEKRARKWFSARYSEVAYFLGDIEGSIRLAEESDSEYWKAVAERLKDPARAHLKAVTIPVGFVRQHQMTCAPATLSALSRYWDMPADHLQVADEICYNGTSNYSERKWAEEHGWLARDFSITEESTIALIDRGIPFTFTTVDPGNSHLQAIIGYDARRGTLVTRDPFWRNSGEGLMDKILERYRLHGPRGMAMVPKVQAERLADLVLPDEKLWDLLHKLDGALVNHRRVDAEAALAEMQTQDPTHRLTLEARRRLAIYDGNSADQLAVVNEQAALFPDDQNLQLERLSLMRHQSRREDRLTAFAELCKKKETHPLYWQQYAQELRLDARRHTEAIWLLRRAIRRWPTEGANYYILANIFWDQRKFEEALELYRFAACLGDKDEQLVMSYFSAACWFRQAPDVLRFLRDRFERFGGKSSQPARTLANAYMQMDLNREALSTVEAAIGLRPQDGELLLFAADLYVACSLENRPRALELLEQARDKAPRGQWLRTSARLANLVGEHQESLSLWQEVLAFSPLALDAHSAVTRLLAVIQGQEAARAHLRAACDCFPHYHPLHELMIEWLRDEPTSVREPVVRRLVAITPDDGWARRELAFLLCDERRFEEAWLEAEIAGRLDPNNQSYYLLRAKLFRDQGNMSLAKEELRKAIVDSADNNYAITEWMNLCESIGERRKVLMFFKEELERQVLFGDGLLALREQASNTLEPEELLKVLLDAKEQRPDLWHAWSSLMLQLLDMNRLEEAWSIAQEASERFPLLPKLWLDRALICRARLDWTGEREALENAYRINPSWGTAVRQLCEFYDQQGEFEKLRALLELAVARNPLDVSNLGMLAETLWRLGEKEPALAHAQKAVQMEPGYTRAWDMLNSWADELGRPEIALETVQELTVRRPGEARSWLMLARILDGPDQLPQMLEALDKALALQPRLTEAFDYKVRALAAAGRLEEAFAACRPAVFGDSIPLELRARESWLESERGDVKAAISKMRALVAEEPFYFWAWSRLCDWYQQTGNADGYLESAQALVKINPQYEVSMGYLGEARLIKGDRAGALEAYKRAFELAPRYEFAGLSLFDLQLEDGKLAEAATTLETLDKFVSGPLVDARGAQLAAKQGDKKTTLHRLRSVCSKPFEIPWPVEAAVEAADSAGWTSEAEEALALCLALPNPPAVVGRCWVKLGTRRGWQCEERLPELVEKGDIGLEATHAYLKAILEAGEKSRLRRFMETHRSMLEAHTFLWGSIGWVLTAFRDYHGAANWMMDWRKREDAQPWMLVNTVEGFRNTSREAIAAECSRHALTLKGNGRHLHHLWLAGDAALEGDYKSAREHLEQSHAEPLDADYEFLEVLTQSIVELGEVSPDVRKRIFPQIQTRLDEAKAKYAAYALEPARQRIYRKTLLALAKLRGGPMTWIWYLIRWWNSVPAA